MEDEYGSEWYVPAGSPARGLVNALHRRGVTWVVLPRHTLMTGALEVPAQVPEKLAAMRMSDCLEALA